MAEYMNQLAEDTGVRVRDVYSYQNFSFAKFISTFISTNVHPFILYIVGSTGVGAGDILP